MNDLTWRPALRGYPIRRTCKIPTSRHPLRRHWSRLSRPYAEDRPEGSTAPTMGPELNTNDQQQTEKFSSFSQYKQKNKKTPTHSHTHAHTYNHTYIDLTCNCIFIVCINVLKFCIFFFFLLIFSLIEF